MSIYPSLYPCHDPLPSQADFGGIRTWGCHQPPAGSLLCGSHSELYSRVVSKSLWCASSITCSCMRALIEGNAKQRPPGAPSGRGRRFAGGGKAWYHRAIGGIGGIGGVESLVRGPEAEGKGKGTGTAWRGYLSSSSTTQLHAWDPPCGGGRGRGRGRAHACLVLPSCYMKPSR